MLGVNCTPPAYMEALIHRLCQNTSLPVAVYPNSGEEYDPRTKGWHGQQAGPSFGEYAERWMRAGAKAVGGCCRTVARHIGEVAAARRRVLGLDEG